MMTRRKAIKLTGLATLGAWAGTARVSAQRRPTDLKLGVTSITLSSQPADMVIAELKKMDIHFATVAKAHCPWDGTPEQCHAAIKKFTDAGIKVTGTNVLALPNNEAALRKTFDNVKAAGLATMDCKPEPQAISLLEKFVKEYDIRLAIHNHGPGDTYPSPLAAWKLIEPYDSRIGVCIDVGHCWRAGTDPAEAIRTCRSRLYDIHLKDSLAHPGARHDIPVEVGKGHMDIKGILAALVEINYQNVVDFEYEKKTNPVTGLEESIDYVRKVLAGMPA